MRRHLRFNLMSSMAIIALCAMLVWGVEEFRARRARAAAIADLESDLAGFIYSNFYPPFDFGNRQRRILSREDHELLEQVARDVFRHRITKLNYNPDNLFRMIRGFRTQNIKGWPPYEAPPEAAQRGVAAGGVADAEIQPKALPALPPGR